MTKRCQSIQDKPDDYVHYHDQEWCRPTHDNQELFKWLILEMFSSGLSWQLILSKEENFRQAFANYQVDQVANFGAYDVERLMTDESIIRHKKKILAAITNAQVFLWIERKYGSFNNYIWSFTDGQTLHNEGGPMPKKTALSDKITKDMKEKGFKWLGSITVYSYLQAIGIVNDHDLDCAFYEEVKNSSR